MVGHSRVVAKSPAAPSPRSGGAVGASKAKRPTARVEPSRLVVDGDLVLHGTVGGSSFFDSEGFTAAEVIRALSQLGSRREITVRINSGGGLALDGISIYNSLRKHKGRVTVSVEAIAASAASIIAMAGDRIEMREGALLMIHNASAISIGTREDHEKAAETLRKIDGEMAEIYASRTGLKLERVQTMMDAETWLNGAEAVQLGFADRQVKGKATAVAKFDWSLYQHAPAALTGVRERPQRPVDSIRSLSDFRRWLQSQGFSTTEAKLLAAGGWPRLRPDRQPSQSELAKLAAHISAQTAKLRSQLRGLSP